MFQESIPFKALHCCQIIQSKVDIQRTYFSGYHESQQSLHLYPPPLLSPPLPLWHQSPFLPTASFSCFHVLWVFCMCDYIYKKSINHKWEKRWYLCVSIWFFCSMWKSPTASIFQERTWFIPPLWPNIKLLRMYIAFIHVLTSW